MSALGASMCGLPARLYTCAQSAPARLYMHAQAHARTVCLLGYTCTRTMHTGLFCHSPSLLYCFMLCTHSQDKHCTFILNSPPKANPTESPLPERAVAIVMSLQYYTHLKNSKLIVTVSNRRRCKSGQSNQTLVQL